MGCRILGQLCVLRVERKPAAQPPATGCRPGGELTAEGCRALPHPHEPVPWPVPLGGRTGDHRSSGLGHERRSGVGNLDREGGPGARRVARGVRERFLGDPVESDRDAGGDAGQVPSHLQLDGKASRPRIVDQRRDLARRGEGRRYGGLVRAAKQRDRTAKLLHAAPPHLLRGPQRLLGGSRVAVQHVAGAGDLKHCGRQAVTDEVVDVARDPTPLREQCLLGELATGGVKLDRQVLLAGGEAPEHPREDNAHDPDAHRNLGRILDHACRDGSGDR
jgi:hypothetical protein